MRYDRLVEHRPAEHPVVFVSGGTGVLGAPLVSRLLADGCRVAFTYRTQADKAETLAKQGALALRCDMGDARQTAAALAETRQTLGEVDALVHAAIDPVRPLRFDAKGAAALAALHRTQTGGLLNMLDAVLPAMRWRQSGVIVAVLSEVLTKPHVPGWAGYLAAKASLAAVVQALAAEMEPCGLRVLGVLPGALKAAAADVASPGERPTALDRANARGIRANWPLGLDPETAAAAIAAAVTDAANHPNGSWITLNALAAPAVRSGARFFRPLEETPPPAVPASDAPAGAQPAGKPQAAQTEDAVARKLADVFRGLFKLAATDPVEQAALGLWKGWDSLNHLRLLMEVEAAFGIDFSSTEAAQLASFSSLLEAVRRLSPRG